MFALKRDSAANHLIKINAAKTDWQRKQMLWTLLLRNIYISRKDRNNSEKALEFK